MLITFDPVKSARNAARRGLPFELAYEFEWTSAIVVADIRRSYGEARYLALGLIGSHLHALVFTPREGAIRVISLRRASRRERKHYATQAEAKPD